MKIRAQLNRAGAGAAVASVLGLLTVTGVAHADPCVDVFAGKDVVYATGSSAVKPFLIEVSAALAKLSKPVTLLYGSASSGAGVDPFKTGADGTTEVPTSYSNWGADKAETKCEPEPGVPTPIDIGFSDVWPKTFGVTVANDVKDFHGPIQAMTFVVPTASSKTVISAEAAYLIYGLGKDSGIAPWTDQAGEDLIQKRDQTSGTQLMVASYLKLPKELPVGHPNKGSGDLITSLSNAAAAGNAEKAIGILATDGADKNRTTLKILAYQHYDQKCGYWPDSTAASYDKQNVRDGHYMIWGPVHMLTRMNGSDIKNANAKKVIDLMTLKDTSVDLISIEAKGGVVPECAMRVTRSGDGEPLQSFMPDQSCECAYRTAVAGKAVDGCKACTTASDCPSSAKACNFGYCEVQ